ncbi:hypothetical protein IJG98_01620 [Candidatus Saccharibacteria bacterium]|nr:hypothetical protein [Candidatus Saccharibacteria bacterium]
MSKKLIAGAGVVASFAIALAPLATFADTVNPSDQHTDKLILTVLPSCTFGSAARTESGAPDYFVSGITHDNSEGNYAADTANGTKSATAWTTAETTTGTAGATDSTDSGDHNTAVLDSTGYGVLEGEGGVTSTNGRTNASHHTVHRSMLAGTSTANFATTTLYVVCNNGGGYSVTSTATALSNGTVAEDIPVVAASGYSDTTSGYNGIVSVETSNGMTRVADIVQNGETIIATKAGVSKDDGDSVTIEYGAGIKSSQKADTYVGTVTYKLYKGVNGANTSGN